MEQIIKRKQQLKDLIFLVWGQEKCYDQVSFGMLKVFDIYCKECRNFMKMSLRTQYDILYTCNLIVVSSIREHIHKTPILFKRPPKEFKYSIYSLDKKPEYIDISRQLTEKIEP